ncbi:MAG TPA: hypothetical protein VGR95_05680 [Thermoanaerobaculia bacterium]|jgi:hypothetical protein|nr:hypothetical protein [Thermoanaerobaculia bacterium]
MQQKKVLTQQERDAITAKYQRRIIELGIPVFGPPDEGDLGPNVVPFPDPNAEERATAAEAGRAKAQEFQDRIVDATIQLLETAPPPDELRPAHRKPGDLDRTAARLRAHEVDLPEGFDPEQEAATFEGQAKFSRAQIAFGQEMDAVALEALTGLLPILEAVRDFALNVFHEVKRWAEEDPDGPGADLYRELNKARRKGAGRSRGR